MSNVKSQKRIAAGVLGIGLSRVWVSPEAAVDVAQAMTREDIRGIIGRGLIKEKPAKKQTRATAKKNVLLKRKRKGVGHGKRRGSIGARAPKKKAWMKKIRSQRNVLTQLKETGAIDVRTYRKYYLRLKGGDYTSKKQLKESMRADGVLKDQK